MKPFPYLFILLLYICMASGVLAQRSDIAVREVIKEPPLPDNPNCCCGGISNKVCGKDGVPLKEILLDFNTKALYLPKEKKRGWFSKSTAFRVRIMNYNPLLYKVVINHTDSAAATPMSGGMLTTMLEPSGLLGMVAGIVANISTAPSISTIQDVQKKPMQALKTMGEKSTQLFMRLKTADDSVRELQSQSVEDIQRFSTNLSNLRNIINNALFNYTRELAKAAAPIRDCAFFQQVASRQSVQQMTNTLQGYLRQLTTMRKDIAQSAFDYAIGITRHYKFVAATPQRQSADTLIKAAFTLLQQEIGKIETSFSYKTIEEIARRYEQLAQLSTCYISLPVFMKKDISDFTIELNPRFDSTGLQPYKTSFFLPWHQRRIWGLSAGVYISSLNNNLYGVQRDSSTAGVRYNIVEEQENSKVEIGANALAYAAWRLSIEKPNYLGLSVGAGLSIESKSKPRIFLGGCYVNGERNRLVVSAGMVAGYVSRLSSAFSGATPYTVEPINFTRDVIKPGVYLSVSYSFL